MNKKKAFTLIELLVVVAIIGLLAAMAVIALNNARWKARDSRRLADIKQFRTALEMYYSDSATGYPSGSSLNLGGLCLSSTNGWNAACAGTTYFASAPTNPSPRPEQMAAVRIRTIFIIQLAALPTPLAIV